MNFFYAGTLAAGSVWVLNKFILKREQELGIMLIIPVLEEGLKTGTALLFSASVLLTHGMFGTVEAIIDLFSNKNKGIAAGLASYMGHLVFGLLTLYGKEQWDSYWIGFSLAVIAHIGWNTAIMMIARKESRP